MIKLEDLVFYSAGNKFDPSKFESVHNSSAWDNKPIGGYWASPVFHPADWSSWLDLQKQLSGWTVPRPQGGTFFRLRSHACIAYIITPSCYDQITEEFALGEEPQMPHDATFLDYILISEKGENPLAFKPIDYEALSKEGYDAVYCEPAAFEALGRRAGVHSWDCATLVVLNPKVVQDIHYSSAPRSGRKAAAIALYPDCRASFAELRRIFDRQDWLSAWLQLLSSLSYREYLYHRAMRITHACDFSPQTHGHPTGRIEN